MRVWFFYPPSYLTPYAAPGHFYSTKLLLPTLLSTAKTSPDGTVRVVNTAFSGHTIVDKIDFDTLKDGPTRRKQSTEVLYQQSKLGDILIAFELARRYGDQGIVSVTLHPGILKTDLLRHTNFLKRAALVCMLY